MSHKKEMIAILERIKELLLLLDCIAEDQDELASQNELPSHPSAWKDAVSSQPNEVIHVL